MRAVLALALALAACSPDIVSGAYLCGPNESCPPGQACNGADGTCVLPSLAMPFACDPKVENEPDNTPAQALVLTGLSCVSGLVVDQGCLAAGDGADWVSFTAPQGCVAVGIQARVTYPMAFEPIGLELWDLGSMTQLTSDQTCTSTTGLGEGEDARCLTMTLQSGGSYGVKVRPAGGGDCNGHCNFNTYDLTVQLRTP